MVWRTCSGCGFVKWLEPGELCPPCTSRARSQPEPAGDTPPFRRGLDGSRALELLDAMYGDRASAEQRTRERYAAADAVTDGDSALRWLAENAVVTISHRYG